MQPGSLWKNQAQLKNGSPIAGENQCTSSWQSAGGCGGGDGGGEGGGGEGGGGDGGGDSTVVGSEKEKSARTLY